MSQLRGYQQEAVAAIVAGLAGGGRGQVHAACGAGKTLLSLAAALRLTPAGGLVVAAVPSLALVAQTLQVWAGEQAAGGSLAVCGDETIGDAPVRVGDLRCPVTRDSGCPGQWHDDHRE